MCQFDVFNKPHAYALTMFLDNPRRHDHAMRTHVRRHRFLYLSLLLHALPLAALGYLGHVGNIRIESARRERLLESGMQLTEQARLEKRVRDMAEIKSLLEQSAGGTRSTPIGPREHQEAPLPFSVEPKRPNALLKEAKELARAIETIERDIKAEELAKLLKIPKEKALVHLAEVRKPAQADIEPKTRAEAAAKIAQLETKARQVLQQRRQQLEGRRNGMPVTASASLGRDKAKPVLPGQSSSRNGSKHDTDVAEREQADGGGHKGDGRGGHGDGEGQGSTGEGEGEGAGGDASRTSLLDRIAAFSNPDLPDRKTSEYTAGGLANFYESGIGHIPDVDANRMVTGAGRIIGSGGPYANRVYVNSWYLIGPFQGKFGGELFSNFRYPPEDAVVLDAVYRGKGNRMLKWKYINLSKYPLIPPDEAENAVYYGYTELMLEKAQDLTIWVGADDDAQLWINDQLAWKGGNVNKEWFFGEIYETANAYVRDYNLTEGKRVVHFRKGRNKLFFKLSNGPTRLFFSLILTKEP